MVQMCATPRHARTEARAWCISETLTGTTVNAEAYSPEATVKVSVLFTVK